MQNQLGMGLSNVREFLQLMRKYRPTVLMYTLGGAVRWWPLLGRLTGIRRSVYWDQTSRTSKTYGYRASRHVQLAMSALSESICGSKFVKACSDREGIIPPQKSRVIYNAADTSRALGDGEVFRQKYGIPDGRIVVLKVSWLIPEKGIDLVLRGVFYWRQLRGALLSRLFRGGCALSRDADGLGASHRDRHGVT